MKLNTSSHAQPILSSFTPTTKSQMLNKPSNVRIYKRDEIETLNQSLKRSKSKQ